MSGYNFMQSLFSKFYSVLSGTNVMYWYSLNEQDYLILLQWQVWTAQI